MDSSEETAIVKAFVVKEKRERLAGLLANPKRRKEVTSSLAHFNDLDPRWIVRIAPDQDKPETLAKALTKRGAGGTCYLISENKELDGTRLDLTEALKLVIGNGMGTIVSCVPGELGFFEGEGPSDRYLLVRPRG